MTAPLSLFLLFLLLHGLLGGLDVVVNHELIVGLPRRPGCAPEQRLHSAREAIFASLFLAFAWWEWHGAWIWLPAALMAAELLVSLRDVAVEGATRILPVTEATLHVVLFVNLGAVYAFGGLLLWDWSDLPSAVAPVHHGRASNALTLLAVLAYGWCLRDYLSARLADRQAQQQARERARLEAQAAAAP